MISRTRLICWAAGFFDGEGSVMIARERQKRNSGGAIYYFRLIIGASNTDVEPLNRLVALFGGFIIDGGVRRSGQKPTFLWRLASDKAADALVEMLPYLTVKKEQARVGIEFQPLRQKGRTTEEERIRRFVRDSSYRDEMKLLNQRGTISVV